MNQQSYLNRISQLLSRLTEQVKILNNNGEFSINIHAENCLIGILNIVFDCQLKNVNYEKNKIYPSIDLRDPKKRVAFQVTASSSITKIKHTLSEFIKNGLYQDYDFLYVFIITEKQKNYKQSSFDKIIMNRFSFSKECIIDKADIYKRLNALNDIHKIQSVCNLLEEQFSDNTMDDKWRVYYKGLKEYDDYIANLYKYLDIKGFSPRVNNTLVRLSIDKIYVPLKFKYDFTNNDNEISSRDARKSYEISTALDTFSTIVILGDPGSGKSTSLKYLAYSICSHRIDTSQKSLYIPVFIKATDYAKYLADTRRSLSEYIIDSSSKYGSLFSHALEDNKLVLLFDGLDEINITNQRHAVGDKINAFVAQYPEAKIIVSSRKVGYMETRLSGAFFHFEVDKFSDEQILSFLNNWYLSISIISDNNQAKASEEANTLFRAIKRNESVYKLSSNPLLITIIALINYQGNHLPEKRAALYGIATSTLLDNWVKLRENHNSNIERDVLIELLASVAFYIHENYSSGLIPEKELREILTKNYSTIHSFISTKDLKKDVNEIISFLREDAGFLFEKGYNENGDALFGFIHLSFQEYFAAIEFNAKWKEGSLGGLNNYINNSSWAEVIKLAASLFKINEHGRMGRSFATKYVSDILNEKDIFPDPSRRFILASQILNEDVEVDPQIVISLIDELIGFVSSTGEEKTAYYFDGSLNLLLSSKYYQEYLLDRIKEIITANTSTFLSRRLIKILMHSSDITIVQDYLLSVLRSNQDEIKTYLFDYSTVFPVADVVKTEQFRSEIVKYVNSPSYREKYNGSLPTQYACCFDNGMEDWFLSISLVEDDIMKKDLIDFYVFSWGISDVDKLKVYYETIKNTYPLLNLSKIKNYLAEQEEYYSLGIEDYPIIEFKSVKIYKRNRSDHSYALIYKKRITLIERPFTSEDFDLPLGPKANSFAQFCNMIITAERSESKEVIIRNDVELDLLIKYYDTIHWFPSININGAQIFAMAHLFDKDSINLPLLKWIKRTYFSYRVRRTKFESSFDKEAFVELVKSSSLSLFDKLLLLKLSCPEFKDKEMLASAMEEYNRLDPKVDKTEYRRVLYDYL